MKAGEEASELLASCSHCKAERAAAGAGAVSYPLPAPGTTTLTGG